MLQRLKSQHPIETLETIASAEEILICQEAVRQVHVDEKVIRYIVQLIQATREITTSFGRQSARVHGAAPLRPVVRGHSGL